MSTAPASIALAASNGEWGSNVVLNDLVVRTSNASQQVHVISNSNVGLRVSNDTVFVHSNLRAWSVAAPVMNASNVVTSNLTASNLVSSNCTFGAVTVTGSLNAPGVGGLGTALVQHRLPTTSNPNTWYAANVYATRPLNALLTNTNTNVLALANNQVWLQPGTYVCMWDASADVNQSCSYHSRVWNSNLNAVADGLGAFAYAGGGLKLTGSGVVTVAAPSNALEVQLITSTTSNLLQRNQTTGSNVYTSLYLNRIA